MSIQDLHITVGITPAGEVKNLYTGVDAIKAGEALSRAGQEFAEVGIISHPQAVHPRHPKEEAELATFNARAAVARAEAKTKADVKSVDDKRLAASKLMAEANALESTLKPAEKPTEKKPASKTP